LIISVIGEERRSARGGEEILLPFYFGGGDKKEREKKHNNGFLFPLSLVQKIRKDSREGEGVTCRAGISRDLKEEKSRKGGPHQI